MPTLMKGKHPKTGREETVAVPDCFIPSRVAMGYVVVEATDASARAATARTMKAPTGPGARFTAAIAGDQPPAGDTTAPGAPTPSRGSARQRQEAAAAAASATTEPPAGDTTAPGTE